MNLYDKEIEEAVLGICLLESTAFGRTYNLVDKNSFYSEDNQKVYECLKQMYDSSIPIDLLTVFDFMTRKNVKLSAGNNPWYLTALSKNVVSSHHLEYHCWIL